LSNADIHSWKRYHTGRPRGFSLHYGDATSGKLFVSGHGRSHDECLGLGFTRSSGLAIMFCAKIVANFVCCNQAVSDQADPAFAESRAEVAVAKCSAPGDADRRRGKIPACIQMRQPKTILGWCPHAIFRELIEQVTVIERAVKWIGCVVEGIYALHVQLHSHLLAKVAIDVVEPSRYSCSGGHVAALRIGEQGISQNAHGDFSNSARAF
jgi:hypothetical protein